MSTSVPQRLAVGHADVLPIHRPHARTRCTIGPQHAAELWYNGRMSAIAMPEPDWITRVRRRLLRWYRAQRRDLPWRRTPADPYHVLVSELMLQQTQVATVLPYFERFVTALPDVQSLAAAQEQQVLRLWQGLGYYRRARHLHAAAKQIVASHAGNMPRSAEQLAKLPGVGRYTAGAIASIAFGERAPVVDGNVARVLARWLALERPIDEPAVRAALWRVADELVPGRSPGDFNQALMELGALRCLPRQPRCGSCPVRADCGAHAAGKVGQLPVRLERARARAVTHHVLAVVRAQRLLFEQRPERGLWARLWQLPTAESLGDTIEAHDLQQWGRKERGLRLALPQRVGAFTHQTTHRTICFVVWRARYQAGSVQCAGVVWRAADDVDDLPLAAAQQRVLAMLADQGAQRAVRVPG